MEFFDQRIDKGLLARLQHVLESSFERMSYTEAVEHLEQCGERSSIRCSCGANLQAEHERYLTEKVLRQAAVLVDYPKADQGVLHAPQRRRRTVAAMDLLVPGVGELIGGSQREERLDVLDRRLEEQGLPK